jgi:hypothetical protein
MKIIRKWRMYVRKEVDLDDFEDTLKNFGWLVDGNIVFDCGYRRECHFRQIYKNKFVNFNNMVKGGEKA